jgi:hypothetical protein
MAQNDVENVSSQEPADRPPLKWTIMIYLAGDNNLSANSIAIMQELEAAYCSDDVRVLACFDSNRPRPKGARYLEINHRRKTTEPQTGMCWGLHNDLVPSEERGDHAVAYPDFCNPNPASVPDITEPIAKEGLSRFLQWALKNHRAEKHMLVLFGHGSAVAGNTFLADSNPPSFLRLKDFADVLARHFDDVPGTGKPKLDILACDNCIMNGIEAAYQIRKQVSYMIGSQGLMLAVGWPFGKIINAVVSHRTEEPKRIALRVVEACARNLLDFSLMDRSSEQALCDLTTLCKDENKDEKKGENRDENRAKNIARAVKELSEAMQEGLKYDDCGEVICPAVRDAIKLARLEAQSYWSETFVDLYDFCALLLKKCNDTLQQVNSVLNQRRLLTKDSAKFKRADEERFFNPREIEGMKLFEAIAAGCKAVLDSIKDKKALLCSDKGEKFVLCSYYVGPELQYSNGVSIYFPWALPEDPLIFEPKPIKPVGSGRSSKRLSSGSNGDVKPPEDFIIRTPFEEYKTYEFAKSDAGDWAAFLRSFFKATLRNVRRFEVEYKEVGRSPDEFFAAKIIHEPFIAPTSVDLQKSGSDVDSEEDCTCPKIKNYPRRHYISPADCLRKCGQMRTDHTMNDEDKKHCASYLGWNIRGLVAKVIGLKRPDRKLKASGKSADSHEAEPEDELPES